MKEAFRKSGKVALITAIVLLPLLGKTYLLEVEEAFSAEIAREMLVAKDFVRPRFDFVPAWERLPLLSWMQAFCLWLFGPGAFAIRLPNAICGILTMVMLYKLGARLYDHRFGMLWVAAFLSGLLPVFLFRSGIEAPWSGLLIFLGLVHLIFFYWKSMGSGVHLRWPVSWYLYSGGVFIGLASLLRGPEAVILPAIVLGIYWLYKNLRFYISVQQFFLFFSLAAIIPLIWLSVDGVLNGPDAVMAIPANQWSLFSVAPEGLRQFWGFYLIVFILGCFPASLFAIQALRYRTPENQENETHEHFEQNDFRRWMKMMLWTVLIFYTLRSAKTPHDAFAAFFPLSFLSAWAVYQILDNRQVFERWLRITIIAIGGIFAVLGTFWALTGYPAGIVALGMGKLSGISTAVPRPVGLPGIVPGAGLVVLGAVAWWYLRKGAALSAFSWLFAAFTAFSLMATITLLPVTVRNATGAAIEFARSKSGEDCYVLPFHFKAPGLLFYSGKSASAHPASSREDWLLFGETDKTVYIIAKHRDAGQLSGYAHLEELYRKDGYVFFRRLY
jgi:4-amino-4-deoxy-L-arabinose transferase-like glycosyltransferase